ncbi:1-aminocyclopropane-1-carboxylate oxidase-like protein 5 [Diplodia seriata]|nr:1-aminocyclopropane-1-carboxylate oxidase-like protein 5 [Diplodia seriata]
MPIPAATLANPDEHSRIHAHTDFGLCTILFQDATGGLEVDPFHTNTFLPATPLPGTCVINVADLLQRWSNDRLRSTRHRVVSPPNPSSSPMLPARYSTAFFVHPSADTMVAPIVMDGEAGGEKEKARYEPVNAGEWRTGITAANYSLPVEAKAAAAAAAS